MFGDCGIISSEINLEGQEKQTHLNRISLHNIRLTAPSSSANLIVSARC